MSPRLASTGSQLAAKFVVAVAFAVLLAFAMASSMAEKQALAASLTPESYLADFEKYRASLSQRSRPWAFTFTISIITAVGFFGLYEIVGHALARVIDRFRPHAEGGPEW